MVQKLGVLMMLSIYCLTISWGGSVSALSPTQQRFEINKDVCQSVEPISSFDHLVQIDFQGIPIKEHSESIGQAIFLNSSFPYYSSEWPIFDSNELIGTLQGLNLYSFSGKDIIFPFHNFW